MFDFLRIVGAGQVHKMCGIFWNGFVIAQFLYFRNIVFKSDELYVSVFNLSAFKPDIHDQEQAAPHDHGYISAVRKFVEISEKKTQFNG